MAMLKCGSHDALSPKQSGQVGASAGLLTPTAKTPVQSGRICKDDPVAACLLSLIHGFVGVTQPFFDAGR